jgi:hypothetical protein
MQDILTSHTAGRVTDWASSAKEYFAWRMSEKVPPSARKSPEDILADLKRDAQAANDHTIDQRPDRELRLRQAGEAAVKARLVDPYSAQFEWPYGFTFGTWKPFMARRVTGYWTCGRVNSRNRMGGYAGSATFVVVLDEDGTAQFVDIAEGKYPIVDTQCSKSVAFLPPARTDLPASAEPPVTSLANELEKLASLRDRGVITDAEFEAQKAKLLGER